MNLEIEKIYSLLHYEINRKEVVMKKYFFTFVVVCLLSIKSFANTVKPIVSVACSAPESLITEFSFDLYATGHPMGGATMFTGMFEIKSEAIACFRGHLRTMVPKEGKLQFNGNLECASKYEVSLSVNTLHFNEGVPYPSILSYRTILPIGKGKWIEQQIVCSAIN